MKDITEHKETQNRQELFNKILLELNNPDEIINSVRRILLLVNDFTDIKTVGVYLKEGKDCHYYEIREGPEGFNEAEDCRCFRDDNNEVNRGVDGIECMCEDVIFGRTDPSSPFITEGGSFWSNSATKFFAPTSDKDRYDHTLSCCDRENYESVALIPLKSREGIIGILQLNDKRPDRLTLEMVKFLEEIGTSVGIIIARKETVEHAKRSETNLRKIIDHSADSIVIVDIEGIVKFVNPAAESFLRSPAAKLLGSSFGFPVIGSEQTEIELVHSSGKGTAVAEMAMVEIEWEGKPSYFVSLHDITARKHAEEEMKETLEKLRKTLAGTIQAISVIIERRDPSTAGHQKTVSEIARAIAQEMGLPADIVEKIRIAGILHDIGKISVPSEILSKPAKLTDVEFSLVKLHPQSAYDILKEAELPFPIAEIALQHHERMDGSGYPKGLKGNDILPEARILAVADVVEAISSHRPYRPALGIDKALDEISKKRGVLYDAEVVDACLRVFVEKGFKLE